MLRILLLGFGLFEIVAPRPVIDACERIGLENPDEARLRSQALEVARIEGLVFVWLLLRGRQRSPIVSTLLALAGGVAVLFPKPLIRLSQVFAYENATDLRLKSWVTPAARLLGALYLLVFALSSRVDAKREHEAVGK